MVSLRKFPVGAEVRVNSPIAGTEFIGHVEEVYTNEEIGTIIRVKDGSGAVAPFFPEEIVSIAPTDPVSYFRWKWVI